MTGKTGARQAGAAGGAGQSGRGWREGDARQRRRRQGTAAAARPGHGRQGLLEGPYGASQQHLSMLWALMPALLLRGGVLAGRASATWQRACVRVPNDALLPDYEVASGFPSNVSACSEQIGRVRIQGCRSMIPCSRELLCKLLGSRSTHVCAGVAARRRPDPDRRRARGAH